MNHVQSPRTDDAGIELLIQAKGKTAARVTPSDINANIRGEYYFTAEQGVDGSCDHGDHIGRDVGALSLLTFCVLVLANGFTVTGESACASPENFGADIGRKVARENAVQKIWPLMGYELKSRLAEAPSIRVTKVGLKAALPASTSMAPRRPPARTRTCASSAWPSCRPPDRLGTLTPRRRPIRWTPATLDSSSR